MNSTAPTHRAAACAMVAALGLHLFPAAARAHHADHRLAVASPKCGWTEGSSLRDQTNLAEFCARSVPSQLRIRGASADRELLWIEVPADLASTLRGDDRSTAGLLREWLVHWRTISGYKTASIRLLRNHAEFAKIYTTMTGDVVSVR